MSPRQPWRAKKILSKLCDGRGTVRPETASRRPPTRRAPSDQRGLEPWAIGAHLPGPRLAPRILEGAEQPEAPAESWGRTCEEDGRRGWRSWAAGHARGWGLGQEGLVLGPRRRREGRQLQLGDAAQATWPRHGRGVAGLGSGTAHPGPRRPAPSPGARGPHPPRAASALPASRWGRPWGGARGHGAPKPQPRGRPAVPRCPPRWPEASPKTPKCLSVPTGLHRPHLP
jgi:hypothetical protein